MIGTVIVPLDGSKLAEHALLYASGIANRSGATLFLLRVASPDAHQTEIIECRDYLRVISHSVSGRVRLEVYRGDPAEEIAKACEEVPDPVIVMSTHGRGGIRRWITGSVADKVVRTSRHPVLLVRAGIELQDQLTLHAILLPVDGSSPSEVAIRYAEDLASTFDSRIHLVRVVDTPSAYSMLSRHMETAVTGNVLDEIVASMKREANEYVTEVAERLRRRGLKVKPVVLEGYPADQLIDYERRGHFQLVVMATAGRAGVGRLVFGSVAERMLKMGRSPVIMIRPPDPVPEDSNHAE
jgi:nucleotide-binding universal stress UspA family protein